MGHLGSAAAPVAADASGGPREAARQWFREPALLPVYRRFEDAYLALPRLLYLELSLVLVEREVHRVLDIGCGAGAALAHLRERLPGAELVGIDPSSEMVSAARARLGSAAHVFQAGAEDVAADLGPFDLVLGYSNLRLWERPVDGLRAVHSVLRPGGLAYLLDLRANLPAALVEELLARLEDAETRTFFSAQLGAAYSPDEVAAFLEQAKVPGAEVRTGGLAGHPLRSAAAFLLLQRSDRVAELAFRMPEESFRSTGSIDSVMHVLIRRAE